MARGGPIASALPLAERAARGPAVTGPRVACPSEARVDSGGAARRLRQRAGSRSVDRPRLLGDGSLAFPLVSRRSWARRGRLIKVPLAPIRGHEQMRVERNRGGFFVPLCECGYRGARCQTETVAMGKLIHHWRQVTRQLRASGQPIPWASTTKPAATPKLIHKSA